MWLFRNNCLFMKMFWDCEVSLILIHSECSIYHKMTASARSNAKFHFEKKVNMTRFIFHKPC